MKIAVIIVRILLGAMMGLALVTGKFVKIALLVLLPVTVNILLINIILAPENEPMAIGIFASHLFLIYANWGSYKHLFTA